MIKFYENTHKYIFEDKDYLSVTSVLKKLDPTDWEDVKARYATKHGLSIEEVTNKWATQADMGTKIHALYENKIIENSTDVFVHDTEEGVKIGRDLSNLTPGKYPELIIYSHRYQIAGQSDLVEFNDKKEFKITDYKTDRNLSFESFKVYDPSIKRKVSQYFKEPISGIELCNYNKYCLQLSMYALMLEQHGYKLSKSPDALKIIHVTTERDEMGDHILDKNGAPIISSTKEYFLPYLKDEVKAILNHHLNN